MIGLIASYVTICNDLTPDELERLIKTYPPPHQIGKEVLKNKNTPSNILEKYSKKSLVLIENYKVNVNK